MVLLRARSSLLSDTYTLPDSLSEMYLSGSNGLLRLDGSFEYDQSSAQRTCHITALVWHPNPALQAGSPSKQQARQVPMPSLAQAASVRH